MLKTLRAISVVLAALASAAAPCVAALDAAAPCPMAGCNDAPFGAFSADPCCCAGSNLPAGPGARPALPGPAVTAPWAQLLSLDAALPQAAACREASDYPSHDVPLYLLNASLLR